MLCCSVYTEMVALLCSACSRSRCRLLSMSNKALTVLGCSLIVVALGVIVWLVLTLLARPSWPAHPKGGSYVRLPEGVASWSTEQHAWLFCPNGLTDIECGA
jgi:hypothetical protein